MRRLLLFSLSLALSASAQAQSGPGTIHYTQGTALYRMPGAPNAVPYRVPNSPAGTFQVTDLRYGPPGYEAHRYTYPVEVGSFVDPASNSTFRYGDYYAWDEVTGSSIQLTRFRGPLVTTTAGLSSRWSNDRQDSFLGLLITDTTTGQRHVVRTFVSAAAIFSDTFQPLTAADLDPNNPAARLELVATFPLHLVHFWNADGSGIYYEDNRNSQRNLLRFHPVGSPAIDQDPIVFDQATTNLRMRWWDVSPTTGLLVLHVSTAGTRSGDPAGLVIVNPNIPGPNNWSWLLKETTGKTGLDIVFHFSSPDGTVVGFLGERRSNGKVAAKGVYCIPITGGTVTTIREESATSTVMGVRRWTW